MSGSVVTRRGCGGLLFERIAGVSPGDVAPNLPDLFDNVDAVCCLWVFRSYVEVEMASERGGRECLAAEGAILVLWSRQLDVGALGICSGARGGGSRFGHCGQGAGGYETRAELRHNYDGGGGIGLSRHRHREKKGDCDGDLIFGIGQGRQERTDRV